MPTFTFENKAGERREYLVPMRSRTIHRDGDRWTRVKEPEGFQLKTQYREDNREDVRRGYYKAEQNGWGSKHSKSTIKKVWGL